MQSVVSEVRPPGAFDDGAAEYADFIAAWIKANDISFRDVERLSNKRFTKSKLHRILHPVQSRRSPMKISEVRDILGILGIDYYQAAISMELLKCRPTSDIDTFTRVALLLATMLKGLPGQLFELIAHIQGLEDADISPSHGVYLKKLILESLETDYKKLVKRKNSREDAIAFDGY